MRNLLNENMAFLGLGALVAVGIILMVLTTIFFPLIFIWALNGLFNLGLEYTIANWFYALLLLLIGKAGAGGSFGKDKK